MKLIRQEDNMMSKIRYMEPEQTRSSFKHIVIWAMAAVFYLYEVALRVAPAGLTDQLMQHFNITSTGLGLLVGAYYWSYVLMQLPCGLILDKFGPQKVISLSALVCGAGTILFCQADTLVPAIFGRILVGVGSACAFIAALKVATDWFSPSRFALIAGLTNMMGTFGGNFAGSPLSYLSEHYGWVNIFTIMGLSGFFIALLAYLIIEDKPSKSFNNFHNFKHILIMLSMNKQIWLAGIIGGILYLPLTAFAELWGVPFLTRVFDGDHFIGSLTTNLVFIGMAVGGPVFAILSNKMKSYKRVLQLTAVFAGCISLLIVFSPFFDRDSVLSLLFLLGFVIGGQVLVFSLAKVNVESSAYGTAMGFTNAIISFVGLFSQVFMGVILDFVWDGSVSEVGTRIYSVSAYQYTIIFLPIFMLICMVVLMFVRDKYEKIAV